MASPPASPTSPPPLPPPPSDAEKRYPTRRPVSLTAKRRGRSPAVAPTPSPSPLPPQSRPASGFSSRYPVRSNRAATTPTPQRGRTLGLAQVPPSDPESPTRPPPSEAPAQPPRSEAPPPALRDVAPHSTGQRGQTLPAPAPPSDPEAPTRPPPSEAPTQPPRLEAPPPLPPALLDIGSSSGAEKDEKLIKIHLDELHTVLDTIGVSDEERRKIINNVSSQCLTVYNQALECEKDRSLKMVKSISLLQYQCEDLCSVLAEKYELSEDAKMTASFSEIHRLLTNAVLRFNELKKQRLKTLQAMQLKLIDLWDQLGVTLETQKKYRYMMCHSTASVDEVIEKNSLAASLLNETRSEVKRLESQLIEEVRMKLAVLDGNLRQTHLSGHRDYELKFTLLDLHEERADILAANERVNELILKSKEAILRREEIVSLAEAEFNLRKGGRPLDKAKVMSLVEKVGAWEIEHNEKFIYDKENLISQLTKLGRVDKDHHLSQPIASLAGDSVPDFEDQDGSDASEDGSDASEDDTDQDDPDFEVSDSEEE